MRRIAWGGIVPLLCLLPTLGYALTLGSISVRSALNQPFEAVIQLASVSGDDLDTASVSIAPNADFKRAGLDRPAVLSDFRFEFGAGRGGKHTVKVTSAAPIRDPILEFLVEVISRQGRMLRQYTVLLDPPELPADFRSSSAIDSPRTAPRRSGSIRRIPAPAPVAQRPAVVRPSSGGSAQPANYGPTRRGETAGELARRLRPSSAISLNQMMMALLRANPQAFGNNNINNLKSGVMLRIPDEQEITSVSRAQATNDFQRQYRDWKAGIASAPPPKVERQVVSEQMRADLARVRAPQRRGESGELVLVPPRDDDQPLAASPGSEAVGAFGPDGLPDGTGATDETNEELRRQRDLAQEQAHTVAREAMELRSRADELELRLGRVEKAFALQSADFATLQARLAQLSEGAQPEGGADDVAIPTEPAQPVDVIAADAGKAAEPVADTPAVNDQQAPGSSGLMAALPEMVEDNWPLLGGALAILGLGAGGMVLARRRRGEVVEPVEELDVEQAMPKMVAGDILTEVNQYLVLGRPQQAEERLKQELAINPERLDLSLKLLEVYSRTSNKEAFDALAAEVFTRLGRDPGRPDWQRVAGMGRRLSPNNPLYAATAPSPTSPGTEPSTPVAGMPPTTATGVASEMAGHALGDEATPEAIPEFQTVVEDDGLAFEELEQELRRLEEEIGATVAEEQGGLGGATDSGAGIGSRPAQPGPAPVPSTPADTRVDAGVDAGADISADLDSLDFDLSFDDLGALEKDDAGAASTTDSSDDSSLDFDWGADEGAAGDDAITLEAPSNPAPQETANTVSDDFGLGFDDEALSLDEAGGDLGPAEGRVSAGMDMEELTTKLDLARAYVDMDDKASAIDILSEVLKESTGALHDEAEALRKQLG